MATTASASTLAEFNARQFFPNQFRIASEQRLLDFCTNELGALLLDQSSTAGTPKSAIVGNPLRLVPLDALNGSGIASNLLNCTGSATTVELNCTGRYLALATGPSISIFDLQKGAIMREFHDHDGPIGGIAWHRSSPWQLASVGADCSLRLWDLRSHPAQIALRRTTRPYRRLEYSPDCNYIACAGQQVSIFDLNFAQSVVHMACSSPATSVCFNPAECLLATASEDRVVRFWDVDTGECVTQSPAFDSPVGQMRFAPDGRFLVANTGQQISCLRWEPFELLAQLPYPHPLQMHTPSPPPPISPPFAQSPGGNAPQIRLLDMRIHGGHLHQLAVVSADPSRMGTACLVTIALEQLEKCGVNNNACAAAASSPDRSVDNSSVPACPIARTAEEEEEQVEVEEEDRDEDDLSPESVTTSATAESMLDSLTFQQPNQPMGTPVALFVSSPKKSPFTAPPNRKRPPPGVQIKRGTSTMDIGTIVATPPRGGADSIYAGSRIHQKRQQQDCIVGSRRPNQLPIIQQQPGTSNNSGNGSADSTSSSSDTNRLIRRGSSLNDVTDPSATINNNSESNNNMPISSIALASAKNRSRSQFQPNRQVKFASSAGSSSSSSSTSNSLTGTGSLVNRRHTQFNINPPQLAEEEDFEEFMEFDPKIRASIDKSSNEVQGLLAKVATHRGNITEHIVTEAARFEEPHVFAQLLEAYMRKPKCYNMGLNAAFLARTHALIGHRNSNYVKLALNFLDMVTERFGDSIRHGLASQEYTIGVDVAAEQRFERCTKCKNALFQIRLNNAFHSDRMDTAQRKRFEKEILPRIDQIIAQSIKQSPQESRANQSSIN